MARLSDKIGAVYVPGWILLGDAQEGTGAIPLIQATEDGNRIARRALVGNAFELAEDDVGSPAYPELAPDEAAARRVRDTRILEAAIQVEADLLVTARRYLRDLDWDFVHRIVVAAPHSALPLVGLYLRRQGVYDTYGSSDGGARTTLNRGLFFWVATRDLLPAAWRWLSACVRAGEEGGRLAYLAQSALQRVDRALQERDEVLWALNQPQNNDIASDALDSLDGVLLRLMGAFDVTARVAHRVLALGDGEYRAGWQSRSWRKRVATSAPDLAALVAPGSPGAHIVEVVRLLRNSIHGEALRPLALGTGPGRLDETMVGLPPADAEALVSAMDALGGRESFGVRVLFPGRIHADPGELVDEVFRRAVSVLDQLMAMTPVELIVAEPLAERDHAPPEDDIFGVATRESIRLQLGLG